MFSTVEKWVLNHLFGSAAGNIVKEGAAIIDIAETIDAKITAIKNLQPTQTLTLEAVTEMLFGEKRTITVVIGNPGAASAAKP